MPSSTPITELGPRWPRRSQLTRLENHGITTVQQLRELDRKTASYSGAGLSSLPDQIDSARAALGLEPVYLRRGVKAVSVPRADIEVDVDMENTEDGVYLWGALVTASGAVGVPTGYHPFATWEPLTPDLEAQNGLRFWRWLMAIRSLAHEHGNSFHAYCYNAAAENTHLRRLGQMADIADEVEAFIRSDDWIDLLRVFTNQLITGGPIGLKKVAPLSGFSWTVEDPGGGESMLRYDVAVGGFGNDEETAARRWLVAYNQGDVQATLALRDWLEENGVAIPAIESFDPVARGA